MHPLQNGSQVEVKPAAKPKVGPAGYFTEGGEGTAPSYPGADWFNAVIEEFKSVYQAAGLTFEPNKFDHLKRAINKGLAEHTDQQITPDPHDQYVKKTVVLPNNQDLNSVIETNFYRLSGTVINGPPKPVSYGQLIVSQGGDTVLQIVASYNVPNFFFRSGNPINENGTWGPWVEMTHSENFGAVLGEIGYKYFNTFQYYSLFDYARGMRVWVVNNGVREEYFCEKAHTKATPISPVNDSTGTWLKLGYQNGEYNPNRTYKKGDIVSFLTSEGLKHYWCNKDHDHAMQVEPGSDVSDTWREYPYKHGENAQGNFFLRFDGWLTQLGKFQTEVVSSSVSVKRLTLPVAFKDNSYHITFSKQTYVYYQHSFESRDPNGCNVLSWVNPNVSSGNYSSTLDWVAQGWADL